MILLKFLVRNNPNYNDFHELCLNYALFENLRNIGKKDSDDPEQLYKPELAKERWMKIINDRIGLGYPKKRSY